MTTKNKRTFFKKENLIEKRLKNKLKSQYKKSLKEEEGDEDENEEPIGDEDFDGDDTPISDDEEGFAPNQEIGDDEGGDNFDQADDDLDDEDEDDFDALNDNQKEWFDDEVDDLLEPAAEELENEEHADSDDLDIETEAEDLSSGTDDSVFSAEELNDLIDSDDTLHDLEHELTDLAVDVDGDEDDFDADEDEDLDDIENDEENIDTDEEDLDVDEDDLDTDEEDLDVDEEEDDDEMLESEIMAEAEIHHELKNKMKRNKSKRMRHEANEKEWVRGDKLYGSDYEWEKESDPNDIQKTKYSGVKQPSDGHAKGIAKTNAGLTQKMKNIKRESVEKSKMLVLAANRIKNLTESNNRLRINNFKLMKANGILAAVGSKLDTKSRAFVAESFLKCKTVNQVEKLYEKIVKTIKNKSKKPINETITRKSKTSNSNLLINKGKNELKESNEPGKMSFEMQRKLHLMGLQGGDDAYYNNY